MPTITILTIQTSSLRLTEQPSRWLDQQNASPVPLPGSQPADDDSIHSVTGPLRLARLRSHNTVCPTSQHPMTSSHSRFITWTTSSAPWHGCNSVTATC